MIIWGKVVGATIGLVLYGPAGLVLGLVFGQLFDNGIRTILNSPLHTAEVRSVFFKSVFQTMGYIAKLNGVVSENEIKVARDIMLHDFHLDHNQMLLAIQFFNEGKSHEFELEATISRFKAVCGKYENLRRFFLELQVKAAMADKVLGDNERGRLVYICGRLGIPLSELEYQLQAYGYNFYTNSANKKNHANTAGYQQNSQSSALSAAYNLLGVSPNDNLKTIKSAYRRLISKYHPDKLMARGLPLEMMNIAKEKTQQLTVAYDLIMRSRE